MIWVSYEAKKMRVVLGHPRAPVTAADELRRVYVFTDQSSPSHLLLYGDCLYKETKNHLVNAYFKAIVCIYRLKFAYSTLIVRRLPVYTDQLLPSHL